MNFTLKQLEVFSAVVKHGSALAASKHLNISQPAVSSALAELENNLGNPLFDRWRKRIILNDRGRALLPQARLLLSNARDIDESFGTITDQLRGTIRLGASRTIASFIIPEILSAFVNQHPSVKIDVVGSNKSGIISQVEDFSLDIGIIAGKSNRPFIENISWLTDELCVFSGPSHPLTQKTKVSLKELGESDWVLREVGSGTLEVFLNALPPEIKPLKTIMEFNSLEPIKRVIEHSNALSCISKKAVAREVRTDILKQIPTPYLNLNRDYYILIHQQRRQSRLLNSFLNHCTGYPKNIPEI